MTRVLSGAVLIALAVGVVWFATSYMFLAVAALLLVLGVSELIVLSRASALDVPAFPAMMAAALAMAVVGLPDLSGRMLDVVFMAALPGLGLATLGAWRGGPNALASASASLFPALYLGLPIGALVAVRRLGGPPALFLLMLTIIISDSMQYYTGRLFGRRPLAPIVSPKKTVEGAIGGFVFGTAAFAIIGAWWLPQIPAGLRAGLGLTIVALGIAGDLFESMLKRSANVKDSSSLIPGHGGILDRIDALLFAAPVYYIVLRYV
ncbi:MAG TPA: phosphatidate cytidylyltransferase [Vicinamibacterales bacterium]|nr:phosphatidate cytidylyltransferase [Vicinamibacterales bacterium]